jgi:LmbE family N-acetylglucosaminyl deacetylase
MTPKRILCLHAHPDDAEILAGGTLALLAQGGHHVIIATMTAGDCGSAELSPEDIGDIRRREASKAAALIGAEYHCVGFNDMVIFSDDASRRRVTAAIRRYRPDIVLTAFPRDYHCDHQATSELARDACFGASAPNYGTQAFDTAHALPGIPHLYFVDPVTGCDISGQPARPDFVVDIATTFETKRKMLAEHESQRAWLQRQHGMDDYMETMSAWTRARGALAGLEYGEGFQIYRGHPWPQSRLLEELLGGFAHNLE